MRSPGLECLFLKRVDLEERFSLDQKLRNK
jgi:hypothetical protein